ncbi:MAG: hypothetical protein NT045_02440 [Candidatus Aureabacteria bacterium]|nr:hypothetical protein [Candidatus Auribacterota bacterium]
MIALACAILVALGLALHYRMRISRTAAEVAQMSALVAAAQEQQKREGARHACQVEELKKELEDAREASKGRARFLGIF